jgi:hypothetical protein
VGGRKRGFRFACTTMGLPYPPTLVVLWILQNYGTYFPLRTAGEGTEGTETKVGATTSTSTDDTDSWTKLRRLHHHQPEHVSACLGSAALRGGYDDDSILRLTRDD